MAGFCVKKVCENKSMRSIVTSAIIFWVLSIAAPAFADTSFFVGDRVQVAAGPLNVRKTADITAAPYGRQPVGKNGVVFQGPVDQSGYTWWFIDYDSGVDGWSVQNFLSSSHAQSQQTAAAATQMQAIYWQLKNILTVLQGLKARQ